MENIDLHTHSTASDGSLTPTELIIEAKKSGLKAIALSDHDSLSGVIEASEQAEKSEIEFVSGIELSLTYKKGTLHMLGYFFDPRSKEFIDKVSELQERRSERNNQIIKKFHDLGIEITLDELIEAAGGPENANAIGRPHIANVLINKGVVANFNEAFDKYIGNGKPAYVQKQKMPPEEGIEILHNANALAVLAHPKYSATDNFDEVEELVATLKKSGLDGIECHYSDHTKEETQFYLGLAEKYDLLVTGGSDFHGAAKPETKLGDLEVSYELLEKMKAVHNKQF